MSWTEKEKPSPFDKQAIRGLYFLDGDLLAKFQEGDLPEKWAEQYQGLKYPVIEFPSGIEAFPQVGGDEKIIVPIHRQMRLPYFATREDAYQRDRDLAEPHQEVSRQGEDSLHLTLEDSRHHHVITYDNVRREMLDIQIIKDEDPLLPTEILALKGEIFDRFQQLPAEHQASLTLALLNGLKQGEWGEWLRGAIEISWPQQAEPEEKLFPITGISREDLQQVHFSEDQIAQLTDEDMGKIAESMADHYVNDLFWDELKFHTQEVLDDKGQRP